MLRSDEVSKSASEIHLNSQSHIMAVELKAQPDLIANEFGNKLPGQELTL